MPKRFAHLADVGLATPVPYSPKARSVWAAVFAHPATGKRTELSTRHEVRTKHPPAAFFADAVALIRAKVNPPTPGAAGGPAGPDPWTWDEALAQARPHVREETGRGYAAAVKALRLTCPELAAPAAVTPDRAARFRKLFATRPTARGTPPKPATVSYYLRSLSGLFNHLRDLDAARFPANPWAGVKAPKGERTKKPAPDEARVSAFFAWVRGRYPGWTALHALLDLKAVTACRTADLCQLRAADLADGRVTFRAETVKTGEARAVPVPADLFGRLAAGAGPTHLWEGAFWAGLKAHRKQSNGLPPAFAWRTVYEVVNNLFAEFNEAVPGERLTPHALRRRAITRTVIALGGNVDAAAAAIGVHPQTARTHYLDAKQAFDGDEVMRRVADALRLG